MSRFGRYMLLMAAWYVPLFYGGDAVWHHFAHHPIPSWVAGLRLVLWIYAVIRYKIPGTSGSLVRCPSPRRWCPNPLRDLSWGGGLGASEAVLG